MTSVRSEMAANVWRVVVSVGQSVEEGEPLVILESMKMEIPVASPHDGVVSNLRVAEGDSVEEGDVMVVLE